MAKFSSNGNAGLESFEVGSYEGGYSFGFLIGKRFSKQIQSRLASDLILNQQLLPFSQTSQGRQLINSLSANNQSKFPNYWDELLGMAKGSNVPILDIILLNFRKEILPFIPRKETNPSEEVDVNDSNDDCSDVLVVSSSMAVAAHNEDGNVALVGHTYLIRGHLRDGISFTAYTFAGELPSCAFGFNNYGLAFTLNSVPPTEDEILAGGIGRNFISRQLLEAKSIDDALSMIESSEVSVGHSYNIIDVKARRILNVETASGCRISIHEIGETPFFHANKYLHLNVRQAHDESSNHRQERAALMPRRTQSDFLSLLGDSADLQFPIYMTGPKLYTLCTVVIDLDERTLSIIEGNPKIAVASHVFPIQNLVNKIP